MKNTLYYVYLLAALIAVATGLGCATSKDVEQVGLQVSSANADLKTVKTTLYELQDSLKEQGKSDKDLSARLEEMEKAQSQMAGDIKTMGGEVTIVKRNQADLGASLSTMAGGQIMSFGGQIDELRHNIETTNAKLDSLKATLAQSIMDLNAALEKYEESQKPKPDGAAGQSAAVLPAGDAEKGKEETSGAGKEGESAAPPPVGDPAQLYQAAYLDYTKGNFELAVAGFRDYLKNFADGEFAGNSQYWIGESLYSMKRYDEALAEFQKVLEKYPESSKAPGALLKEGFCLEALKRPDEAKDTFRQVMEKYPASDAARIAKDRLKPKAKGKSPAR